MKLKNFFSLTLDSNAHSIMLLILRLVAGLGMLPHGLTKVGSPSAWAGDALPGVVQLLVVFFEVAVPVTWFLGALTQLSSLGLAATMTGAIFWHISKGDGFTTRPAGYELAVMYLLVCLVLFLCGPGRFSLDQLWLKRLRRQHQDR